MSRGRPNSKGLDYFPKMVNFYDDDKIFDLMDEYGPLGVTIYDVILTIVYSNGYFVELSKDKLSRMVIRKIGNKWVKNQRVVVQVIDYCAELGLFDKDLLAQNVITSEGIQTRFYKIAVKLMKRRLYSDKYWLLEKEENEEPLLSAPINHISSEENLISSETIPVDSESMRTKEKEKKIKDIYTAPPESYFSDPALNDAFQLYIRTRKSKGENLTREQIYLLRDNLLEVSQKPDEQLAIIKRATMGNWKSFYPFRKQGKKTVQKNKFNNFHQRDNTDVIKQLEAMSGGVTYD